MRGTKKHSWSPVRIRIHDPPVFIFYDNIFHVLSQFMVAFLNGPTGLAVAGPVQEELSVAFAHAPIPRPKTEEEIVANWDELQT